MFSTKCHKMFVFGPFFWLMFVSHSHTHTHFVIDAPIIYLFSLLLLLLWLLLLLFVGEIFFLMCTQFHQNMIADEREITSN